MSERDPGTRTTLSPRIYLEFIFFERVRDSISAESETAWELGGMEVLRDKSHALPVLSLHRVMGYGTPPSFSQCAIEILRSITKLPTLSWYFLSLSDFFLKHFYDGLRKQDRKAVKSAFHFRDRGKNARLH